MKKRRSSRSFRYRDCDAFAEYLHEQSLQGWHFKEFGFGLVFEQGEPADIYYTVEVFPKGTEMDTRPEKNTEEYAEYCEAAGWKLIDSRRKFCVFCRTREDAVPIVEPKERFANIRKAEWLLWLSNAIPVFLLTCFDWIQLLTANFNIWIFNNAMLLILLFMMLSSVERLLEGINLLYWSVTRRRILRAGDIPVYSSGRHRSFIALIPLSFFLVSSVSLAYFQDEYFLPYTLPPVVISLLILPTAVWIACRRPSRSDNWSFQIVAGLGIVFCFGILMTALIIGRDSGDKSVPENVEDFPLIQADYRQMDGEISRTFSDHMGGFLGSRSSFSVAYTGEVPPGADPAQADVSDSLWYTIYQSSRPWILDRLWKDELPEPEDPSEDRTETWNAVSAVSFQRQNGVCNELVRYPDKILILNTDERLDDHQIESIRKKLRPYKMRLP